MLYYFYDFFLLVGGADVSIYIAVTISMPRGYKNGRGWPGGWVKGGGGGGYC